MIKTGNALAYIDSFCGLIPCKVIGIKSDTILVEVTASRPGYKRGERVQVRHRQVLSREFVHIRNRKYSVQNHSWTWCEGEHIAVQSPLPLQATDRFTLGEIKNAREYWGSLTDGDVYMFWKHYTVGTGAGMTLGVDADTCLEDYLCLSAHESILDEVYDR